jgi:hypothetical protein
VEVDISYERPMETFVLAMWIRVYSPIQKAGVFSLESESISDPVFYVVQDAGSKGYVCQAAGDNDFRLVI